MSFKTGDDFRRQKELDEARKAGLAPAELDEDGKEINPHIPQYMTNVPWYLNSDRPTLKHQRNWKEKGEDGMRWYDRGVKVFQATKWRKGACEKWVAARRGPLGGGGAGATPCVGRRAGLWGLGSWSPPRA